MGGGSPPPQTLDGEPHAPAGDPQGIRKSRGPAYGVEVGLLIDLLHLGGLSALAQVDLGERRHTSQSQEALGAMAGQVVSTVLARAECGRPGHHRLDASGLLTQFRHDGTGFVPRSSAVAVDERPPHGDDRRVPPAPGRHGRLTGGGPVTTGRDPASRGHGPSGEDHPVPLAPLPHPLTGPEVVAHRGATAEAAEHTLAAYRQAAAIGADAVECDVRMTRDGVLVCVHDRRIRNTSNGRGVVSALHLAELEQFQFGARAPTAAEPVGRRRDPRRSPTSPTSRTAWSSPSTGCWSTSPPPPARCGWRSRPSTRPGTPARSRRRWSTACAATGCSATAARSSGPGSPPSG